MNNATKLSLRQLRCFVTVAEELHFRRAAERLHISQPPLTQRIQEMERDLGVELFLRAGHRVELTEAGRLVLAEARATLAQADRVREVARLAAQGEAGNLRVSVVVSASFIPAFNEATNAFQRDYPSVTLELTETTSRGAVEALQQRRTDICVVRRGAPVLDGVQQTELARDHLMLVLPSNHRKAAASKVALRDVVDERFIAFASENSLTLSGQVMGLWSRLGLTPRVAQKADNALAILGLVAAGFGNAILPSTVSAIHIPNVIWKPIDMDEQWTASAIVVLYRSDFRNEKLQSRFIEYIERYASEADLIGLPAERVA
jgi:DNA-binding transcriptional LysR family regulator